MKDIIVVSPYTERRHMIDEYEDQLAAAGIDFHLEPVTLENGIVSITARWKMQFLFDMCQRFGEYQRIVFTDAWDVLFFGPKEGLLDKIPAGTIVSAERNCWPEPHLETRINASTGIETPWRFGNLGMIAGNPSMIIGWASAAMGTSELDMMEQAWINRKLAYRDFPVVLDETTSLFYTVSYDREDGSLHKRFRGPCNYRFGTYPQFFHFPGPCSSVPFRAMLRGATESLVAKKEVLEKR